ncbi:MAG: redoxin domain-containing protein [Gemmatimonadaceae bacterium]
MVFNRQSTGDDGWSPVECQQEAGGRRASCLKPGSRSSTFSVESHHVLREFKAMHRMQVELLSDFKREVTIQYGLLHTERFFSNRAYFLIDRGGVIRWACVEETPGTRRENAEILGEIAKLS